VTDAFTNSVTAGIVISSGTLVAATPSSGNALFDIGAGTCASSVAIASVGPAAIPNSYYQTSTYGTTGKLTMTISGTYTPPGGSAGSFSVTGFTGNLVTGTFIGASPALTVYGSNIVPTTLGVCAVGPCIKAGKTFTVSTGVLAIKQTGVPVTLFGVTALATPQTGTFTTGATSISVATNSSGIAAATFTSDTLATDAVRFQSNATSPTDAKPTNTLGGSGFSSTVTTIPGTASTFVIKEFFDSALATKVKSSMVAGVTYYIDVAMADSYGNSVVSSSTTQIQITLTATQGVLSATTVYIPTGCADTANVPAVLGCTSFFGPITLTLASTLTIGSTVAITGSGAVGGTAVSGSKTTTLVSPLPTFAVTAVNGVKPTGAVLYSNSLTVVFSGQANASVGYPAATTISSVGYKIGSGFWASAAVAAANKVVWSVAASFAAGLQTIQFNASDSTLPKNTFVTASTQLLIDNTLPTIAFTTAAGATLTSGQPLTATITDTYGDLDPTMVTANYNGTAIPASSITVTGTNSPGSSVTYSVSITGLPSGKWKVTLNAKDLAGNAATAASLTATFVVLTNATFTTPSGSPPAQSTQSGFTGVSVTWTNNAATSQTANVWFVAYNAKNQVVFASFTQLTFGSGVSATLFQGLSSTLPSGTFTVQVFVVSTTGVALSASTPVTVSF
jgi:hypothetical protein